MSVDPDECYRRVQDVLWRDNGAHVVLLPAGHGADVSVIQGGGAAVWRALSRPLRLEEIGTAVADQGFPAPTPDELARCLEQLHDLGAVSCPAQEEDA